MANYVGCIDFFFRDNFFFFKKRGVEIYQLHRFLGRCGKNEGDR